MLKCGKFGVIGSIPLGIFKLCFVNTVFVLFLFYLLLFVVFC